MSRVGGMGPGRVAAYDVSALSPKPSAEPAAETVAPAIDRRGGGAGGRLAVLGSFGETAAAQLASESAKHDEAMDLARGIVEDAGSGAASALSAHEGRVAGGANFDESYVQFLQDLPDSAFSDYMSDPESSLETAAKVLMPLDRSARDEGLAALAAKAGKSSSALAWEWLTGGRGDRDPALRAAGERLQGAVARGTPFAKALQGAMPDLAAHGAGYDTQALLQLQLLGMIDGETARHDRFQLSVSDGNLADVALAFGGGLSLDGGSANEAELKKIVADGGGGEDVVQALADQAARADSSTRPSVHVFAAHARAIGAILGGVPKEARGAALDKLLGAVGGSRTDVAVDLAGRAFEHTRAGFGASQDELRADLKAAIDAHGVEAGLREVNAKRQFLPPDRAEILQATLGDLGLV